ncbi:autotransporter outer membrane beta-barrel domain-containing protein [Variovorax sp. J22R133]|nr:autotransporter outer membrane beta-barrel domain-containing protein [Variovorax sp. J22R133]MDM0117932.1 autotransporter outer membrane beta-barrel domain-containing protein [Variovorax sp. J22R133]
MLAIQSTGTLITSFGTIGNLPGGVGTMTVTGTDANWSNIGSVVVGGQGMGTLLVDGGGTVETGGGSVGLTAGSTGTVRVTGQGSTWINGPSGGLNIGSFGTGTLTIGDGGAVHDESVGGVKVGTNAGSIGMTTVSGAGSIFSSRLPVVIGNIGNGTLTVADGGIVDAPVVVLAADPRSVGAVNIGAGAGSPAAAPGTLTTQSIAFGAGTGTINFNHTSSNYVFAPRISGSGTINVLAGTSIFTGENTYSGGTTLGGGVLQIASDGNLGAPSGGLTFDNGALRTTATLSTARPATLSTGGGTFETQTGTTLTYRGAITGSGALTKTGGGTLALSEANTFGGGTGINAGTLEVTNDGNLGSPTSALSFNGGTLRATASFTTGRATTLLPGGGTIETQSGVLTHNGTLEGAGALSKSGAGTLILGADNSYTGGTTISSGTLQLGNGGTTGSIVGDVNNNASLVFNRSNALTFSGAISGSGTVTKLNGGLLTLTGASSYSGGTMLKGGQITVGHNTALGSGALVMDEGTTLGFASDGLNLANAVVLTGTSDPVIDTGALTETLSGIISGGGALTKNGTGTLVLAGANSHTGATAVDVGTLRAGAANAFSAASSHTVARGATLDTGGFNQRVAALANSGTVSLVSASAGSTLTVTGPYVGNAGVLRLGTGLPASDRLVIDGATATASGTTNVQIATLGGLGALTTGDGIEVISARNGATTTAQTTRSAFALAGGHVDAGAYEYSLHAADAQGAGENWYLRSTTTVPPVIPPVVPPGESGPPPVVPVQPPTPLPPVQVPTYRAEVPLLAALPGQVRQADLAMMGNLHRRMGDEAPGSWGGPTTQGPSSLAETGTRRAWGRFVSSDLGVEQPGVAQARADLRVSGLQAGTDLLVMNGWRSGVYVGYLDGTADVSGNARGVNGDVGSNDLRSRFLGAYATWMDTSAWYVDSVLQGASHRYEIRPDGNPSVSGKASGFMASVEGGKAFALTERWSVEPQAQLAWQHNSFDDLILGGARVQQDSGSGWIARLGLRIRGDLATAAGRLQPYGRLNFYHANFGGDAALFIGPAASTVIASDGSYSAGEVAAGATLALTPATSLYGEIGHQWNIGGDATVKSSVQGSLGIKVRW